MPRLSITEDNCVLVRALTCVLLNAVGDKAPNCVVVSAETLVAEKPAVCAVPRLDNWLVLSPATCEELIEPNCATVTELKELALIEPICVLVSELRTLVDSAATSALFRPEMVVVESAAACEVVKAPSWPVARLSITEATCVLVRALTCVLLRAVGDRAPNCVVVSAETPPVEIAAVCAVPRLDN